MSQGGAPQWLFSPTAGYYYYDSRTNENVLQNGRRVPAPSQPRNQPESAPLPNQGFEYTGYPLKQNASFALAQGNINPPALGSQRPGNRGNVADDVQRLSIQDPNGYPDGIATRTSLSYTAEGDLITESRAIVSNVVSRVQSAPVERITAPRLLSKGFTAHGKLLGSENPQESLDKAYQIRSRSFFRIGRVFMVLWAEPAGEGKTLVTMRQDLGLIPGRHGQKIYSKVRRFIVVVAGDPGDKFCSALPIVSYGRQGVTKDVKKSEHGIVYTGKVAPSPRDGEQPSRGEDPMLSIAIRIDPDDPTDKLDDMSRIHYGKIYSVEHNIKAKPMGMVNTGYTRALETQFQTTWVRRLGIPVKQQNVVSGPSRRVDNLRPARLGQPVPLTEIQRRALSEYSTVVRDPRLGSRDGTSRGQRSNLSQTGSRIEEEDEENEEEAEKQEESDEDDNDEVETAAGESSRGQHRSAIRKGKQKEQDEDTGHEQRSSRYNAHVRTLVTRGYTVQDATAFLDRHLAQAAANAAQPPGPGQTGGKGKAVDEDDEEGSDNEEEQPEAQTEGKEVEEEEDDDDDDDEEDEDSDEDDDNSDGPGDDAASTAVIVPVAQDPVAAQARQTLAAVNALIAKGYSREQARARVAQLARARRQQRS